MKSLMAVGENDFWYLCFTSLTYKKMALRKGTKHNKQIQLIKHTRSRYLK